MCAVARSFLSPPELSRRFACSESRSIQFPGFVYDSSRDVIRRHVAFDASGSPEGESTLDRGEVVSDANSRSRSQSDSAVVDERASAAVAKRERRGKIAGSEGKARVESFRTFGLTCACNTR